MMQEGRLLLRLVEEARITESDKWVAFYDAQYVLERAQWNLAKLTGNPLAAEPVSRSGGPPTRSAYVAASAPAVPRRTVGHRRACASLVASFAAGVPIEPTNVNPPSPLGHLGRSRIPSKWHGNIHLWV